MVTPAGERWPDDTLRPAVEDSLGAGAYLAALGTHGLGELSPEAQAAAAAFRHVSADLPRQLHGCASGRELNAAGYGQDVGVAAEVGRSDAVPLLTGLSFRPAARLPDHG